MEIFLYCVCIFVTCHSQKSRENVTVQMWISGKVSAHRVLLKPRRHLRVENKSCGSAEKILKVQKGCNRDILTAYCSWMGCFFPSPSLPCLFPLLWAASGCHLTFQQGSWDFWAPRRLCFLSSYCSAWWIQHTVQAGSGDFIKVSAVILEGKSGGRVTREWKRK